jgi:hypothetical protein
VVHAAPIRDKELDDIGVAFAHGIVHGCLLERIGTTDQEFLLGQNLNHADAISLSLDLAGKEHRVLVKSSFFRHERSDIHATGKAYYFFRISRFDRVKELPGELDLLR